MYCKVSQCTFGGEWTSVVGSDGVYGRWMSDRCARAVWEWTANERTRDGTRYSSNTCCIGLSARSTLHTSWCQVRQRTVERTRRCQASRFRLCSTAQSTTFSSFERCWYSVLDGSWGKLLLIDFLIYLNSINLNLLLVNKRSWLWSFSWYLVSWSYGKKEIVIFFLFVSCFLSLSLFIVYGNGRRRTTLYGISSITSIIFNNNQSKNKIFLKKCYFLNLSK